MNLAFKDDPALKVTYDADHKEYNDAFEAGDQEHAARAFAVHWGDGQNWEDLSQRSRDLMVEKIHMIKAGEHNVYGDRYGFSEPGVLNGINVPVLLMEGAQSYGIVGKINDALEHRLCNTSRIVIKEAGHMVPITHPLETAAAISSFWAGST